MVANQTSTTWQRGNTTLGLSCFTLTKGCFPSIANRLNIVRLIAGIYVQNGSRSQGAGLKPGDRILALGKIGMLGVTKVRGCSLAIIATQQR